MKAIRFTNRLCRPYLLTNDVFYILTTPSAIILKYRVILEPGAFGIKYRVKEAKNLGAKFGFRVKKIHINDKENIK